MVFPVLIPVQNILFPGTGRENLKCHGKGRDGKFEACIPGNHGKREFPLTPAISELRNEGFLVEADAFGKGCCFNFGRYRWNCNGLAAASMQFKSFPFWYFLF